MIWPFGGKRRPVASPAPAAPTTPASSDGGPAAVAAPESVPVPPAAWRSAAPLRVTAKAGPLTLTATGAAPVSAAVPVAAPARVPAGRRPVGTVTGLAVVSARPPRAGGQDGLHDPADPAESAPSALPHPAPARRVRTVAESTARPSLVHADDAYLGEPRVAERPATPAWMSGLGSAGTPLDMSAFLFPGLPTIEEAAELEPSPAPPVSRGAQLPRLTLGQSRRRGRDGDRNESQGQAPDTAPDPPAQAPAPAPAPAAPPQAPAPRPEPAPMDAAATEPPQALPHPLPPRGRSDRATDPAPAADPVPDTQSAHAPTAAEDAEDAEPQIRHLPLPHPPSGRPGRSGTAAPEPHAPTAAGSHDAPAPVPGLPRPELPARPAVPVGLRAPLPSHQAAAPEEAADHDTSRPTDSSGATAPVGLHAPLPTRPAGLAAADGTAEPGTPRRSAAPLGLQAPLAHPARRAPRADDASDAPVSVPQDIASTFARLYGADVSSVPVHRGPAADAQATGLSARAFTRDGEVYLPENAGPLEHPRVRGLLAHELTHAVQQRRHGSALPSENSPVGSAMELEAQVVERHVSGDAGVPAPEVARDFVAAVEQADSGHTGGDGHDHGSDQSGTDLSSLVGMSWSPDTGMVPGGEGVQRARTEMEINKEFLDELNEYNLKRGKPSVPGVEALDPEEREKLLIRQRRADNESDPDEIAAAESRKLDWSEWAAQTGSAVVAGLARPFHNMDEERENKLRDDIRDRHERWSRGNTPGEENTELTDLARQDATAGGTTAASAPAQPLDAGALDTLSQQVYDRLVPLLQKDGVIAPGALPGGARGRSARRPPAPGAAKPAAGTPATPKAAAVPAGAAKPALPGAGAKAALGGTGEATEEQEAAKRQLDWSEWAAQTGSAVVAGLARPFHNMDEERENKLRDDIRDMHERWSRGNTPGEENTELTDLARQDGADPSGLPTAPKTPHAGASPTTADLVEQLDETAMAALANRLYGPLSRMMRDQQRITVLRSKGG
ncbi:eCIS core domain-containing protein [Kitasatospora mediocidica]|uniref:eCIS core domain-containing protein n=1 Tax=Kitasatospora mediocidica TaxID=58352 RepID=UPI00056968AD|nr:DUF4157 domain-containing protein [Kitasatospora mediocidica]